MPTITPCLWFDGQAEEAAAFYASVFPDCEVVSVTRSPADNPSTKAGDVLLVSFTIAGQPFTALNGGPQFPFTEAVSFEIDCADQAEVDRYWEALVEGGGVHSACGWLKDRFGVSWQVVPRQMGDYLGGADPEGNRRAMEAMLAMGKLDIEALRRAYEGTTDSLARASLLERLADGWQPVGVVVAAARLHEVGLRDLEGREGLLDRRRAGLQLLGDGSRAESLSSVRVLDHPIDLLLGW